MIGCFSIYIYQSATELVFRKRFTVAALQSKLSGVIYLMIRGAFNYLEKEGEREREEECVYVCV